MAKSSRVEEQAIDTFVVGEKFFVHVVLVAGQDDGELVAVVLGDDLEKSVGW